MFRFPQFVLVAAIAAAFLPARAGAVELGEISSHAALGQPLNADIELRGLGDLSADDIKVSLAPQAEFDRLGLDRNYFLTGLSFTAEVGRNGRGVIRVKSSRTAREPYLDFLVQVAWPQGQVLREYTLLLDPPSYVASQGALPVSMVPTASAVSNPATESARSVASKPAPVAHARQRQATAARKAPVKEKSGLRLVGDKAPSQGAVSEEQLALVQESLDSARRQGEELKGRITELQGQVDKLNQLATLKDVQAAELTARLAERNRQVGAPHADSPGPVAQNVPPVAGATMKPGNP